MNQTANTVMLIRPSHFGFNPETAFTNSFQQQGYQKNIAEKALSEFNAFAEALQREGIRTVIFEDIPTTNTPDAIFPNNWISFYEDGKVVLYPMESPSRRRERRSEIIESLQEIFGYRVNETIDLTSFEKKGKFLEGTGSIVFDHSNKIAYMAISSRSSREVLDQLCEQLDYRPFAFNTTDHLGKPIYHTNVMMSVGEKFVVVCLSCISGSSSGLLSSLEKSSKAIVEISGDQMAAFAGNMLELRNQTGDPFIVLSDTAMKSLTNPQKRTLEQFATLLPIAIPTIERHGGGSVRCMMAEVFLPKVVSNNEVVIRSPKTYDEFEEYFALRWKVLRAPWNQPAGSERDDQEGISNHFMAVQNGKIIGVGRFQELDAETIQVRYMAVDPEFHGKGVGKLLMKSIEVEASSKGYRKVFLQARENAVPFYLVNRYRLIEKTHLLFGSIQHFSMEKRIK